MLERCITSRKQENTDPHYERNISFSYSQEKKYALSNYPTHEKRNQNKVRSETKNGN